MTFFINEKQFEFWKLRRARVPNTTIASNFGISRQAVSKALLTIDGKIETSLLEMAKANKISVVKIDPQLGVLLGRSVPLGVMRSYLSPGVMASRSGTSTMDTVMSVRSMQSAFNCSGIMQMSLASSSFKLLIPQRLQRNYFQK